MFVHRLLALFSREQSHERLHNLLHATIDHYLGQTERLALSSLLHCDLRISIDQQLIYSDEKELLCGLQKEL